MPAISWRKRHGLAAGAAPRRRAPPAPGSLTSGACRWSSPTTGISRGVSASVGERGEVVGRERPDELGRLLAELLLEPHDARVPRRLGLESAREPARRLLEGAVLQQAREQQVARLEQGDVFGVDQLALRQQARDLQVEQGRGDDEELARSVELLLGVELRAGTR